jgi:hypothetical protein
VVYHNLLLILANERRELAIWSHICAFHFFLDDITIARDKQGHVEFQGLFRMVPSHNQSPGPGTTKDSPLLTSKMPNIELATSFC